MIRCFVGIPLPEAYQQGLVEIVERGQKELQSRISWTKKGNWHVTLFFLGDVSEKKVFEVQEALDSIPFSPFPFQAKGGGCFPSSRQPRVIWVGTQQGGQQCASLADRVAKALVPCGFEPDKRPFQAHLTLGRVKKGARDLWTQYLEYLNSIEWPEITLDSFVLWKSELKPHGPVYEVIQKYPLSERDSG